MREMIYLSIREMYLLEIYPVMEIYFCYSGYWLSHCSRIYLQKDLNP